jgi:hypothetical protein
MYVDHSRGKIIASTIDSLFLRKTDGGLLVREYPGDAAAAHKQAAVCNPAVEDHSCVV